MKKSLLSICCTAILLLSLCPGFSQMEIHVKIDGVPCDSVKIQSYNWEKKSGTNLVLPYSSEIVFKQKQSLKPGLYWLTADTNHIASFIVASEKKQKLSMTYAGDSIAFDKNEENTRYQQYIKSMRGFDMQMAALDKEFQQSKNLPQYMLRSLVDSLRARALRIMSAKNAYEQKVIAENPKSLLASIVSVNIELPEVPAEYYGQQDKIQEFVMTHFFENFPWNDPRIFNTSVCNDKLMYFCHDIVYQWDNPQLDTFVIQDLEKALSINKESHLLFYDKLERELGFYMSNYKVEHTYIKMLQHILRTRPDVDKVRINFYEHELKAINKNLEGSVATNFRFVTSKGDTMSLLDFQSEYTLLLLHNPSCHTCREVRNKLAQDQLLNDAIATGRLNVLTMYVENDKRLWDNFLRVEAAAHYKHGWNFDQTIENEDLYETRTIPYMFLLDKDKQVIRKNLLVDEVDMYIKFLGIVK